MQFWSALEPYIERGESAVVYLVAHSTRHSPGTPGARMFVTASGASYGTIGGGGMEAELKHDARRALATRTALPPSAEKLVHRKGGRGQPSGLICAGEQINVRWMIDPSMVSEIATLADHERDGTPARLVIEASGHTIERGVADVRRPPISFVDGDEWRYEETIFEWRRATIIGGGHCGLALTRTLAQLGYHTTVVDVRPDCPTLTANHFANEIRVVDDYRSAARTVTHRAFHHVIVMTADFPSDIRALLGVADVGGFPYVGLMGSPAKIHKIFGALRVEGVSEDVLSSWHAPIGLRIKSNKPEEIAISIAAQILALRDTLFTFTDWPEPNEQT